MTHRPTDNAIVYLYNKLTPDKVLDVSAMTENGKGIKTITAPRTNKSRKYLVEGLRIVSNNLEGYVRAINALGPEYYGYIERFRRIFDDAEQEYTNRVLYMLNELTPGKVLDVSAMTEDGKGIKTIIAPRTNKSRKYCVDGLSIVSTNLQGYERAIRALGPQYYEYIERFRIIFENAEHVHTTLRTTLVNPPPAIPLPQKVVDLTAPLSPPQVAIPTVPLSPPRVTIPGAMYSPPSFPLTQTALRSIFPLGRIIEVTIPVSPTQAKLNAFPQVPIPQATVPNIPRLPGIIPIVPQ